ncbi:hypothetical protein N7491_000636 [Penicillium cf. griseofulvum]|uniref:Uncharacterized protein n=1 Tax=Penicillium cf. griseofulvum TaxID=2972120 RepID=A0A9W9ISM2_9EURO|nr:hypothetical protein N7472_011041 [Penicillium cf. griseofulvum]KAJ5442800.1 hypothetical protein N7445_004551 [Penicillium cf. griseofulvum]KAJ5451454.1 hypothetical protein N7491_000636 [Penicillium cf. griseofulvum]
MAFDMDANTLASKSSDETEERTIYVHANGTCDVALQDLTIKQQEKWSHKTMYISRAVFSDENTYEP